MIRALFSPLRLASLPSRQAGAPKPREGMPSGLWTPAEARPALWPEAGLLADRHRPLPRHAERRHWL